MDRGCVCRVGRQPHHSKQFYGAPRWRALRCLRGTGAARGLRFGLFSRIGSVPERVGVGTDRKTDYDRNGPVHPPAWASGRRDVVDHYTALVGRLKALEETVRNALVANEEVTRQRLLAPVSGDRRRRRRLSEH